MRVLLVEGQTICRSGLAALIEAQTDWTVVASAPSGREGLRLAKELRPDLCITSLMLDELNGIDLAQCVRAASPETKVVLLTRYADQLYYERAAAAGVDAFVSKRDGFSHLIEAVRTIARGRTYLSPTVANLAGRSANGKKPDAAGGRDLTLREREIVQLLAEGRLAKDIAQETGLNVKTVESHRRRVMEKLQLGSVSDLTRFAVRNGLVRLDGVTRDRPGAEAPGGDAL